MPPNGTEQRRTAPMPRMMAGRMTTPLPRRCLRAVLAPMPRVPISGLRAPTTADVGALARLMLAAYAGSVDDEGEDEADALVEVRKTFAGDHGAFDAGSSKLVTRADELLHASLITRWQGRPFVAFTMTAPAAQRAGLARASLIAAMQDLRDQGETELRLVVTLANLPARTLYESLGFVVED